MSDLRGWNKCDDCGRFADPTKMRFEESRYLDLHGNLVERYPQYHKRDEDCLGRKPLIEADVDPGSQP